MKPASFDYYSPESLTEALQLMAQHRDAARPLAGGQSLVPMMNFRLARPALLIDLNNLRELSFLDVVDGELRIGAMTRQRALERSAVVAAGWPLLQEAARHIGHIHIRNRGTIGGSIAHAYPSAELPLAMIALDASFLLRSTQGERIVPARDFFVDVMTTILEPSELLVEIRVPQAESRTGWGFQEVSRRHGDFALAAVASIISLRKDRSIDKVRLVFTGAKPHLSKKTDSLIGQKPDGTMFSDIAATTAAELETESDIHASSEYRREVSQVLARRVLEEATARTAI
ncbi:MAG TPA: xanthine dehydrogenase family protein subunit M [Candidatus Binatia bacterium]|nr:xanthine dehydrogenase family protein subunit M [Candidatus Binatia bacterium]